MRNGMAGFPDESAADSPHDNATFVTAATTKKQEPPGCAPAAHRDHSPLTTNHAPTD
jgi:hypothetical protein